MTGQARSHDAALTRSQAGVVAAQLLDPASTRFTVGEAVELRGPVDVGLLRAAIDEAVGQAPGWALRLDLDGQQVADPDACATSCRVIDVSAGTDPWGGALDRMRGQLARGLRFGGDALHTQRVFVLGRERVVWFCSAHHVLTDGYGIVLLVRRVLAIYAALRAGRRPEPSSFTPLQAVREAELAYEESSAHARDRAYWLDADARAEQAGAVRALLPRGGGIGSGRFAVTVEQLDAAAARVGHTWPDLLAAAHAVTVARLAGHGDVVTGIPLMNRRGPVALAPTSVVNVLPLHVHVAPGALVGDYLGEVAAGLRGLRRHGRFRAEELARATGRADGSAPLVGAELNIKVFDQPGRVGDLDVRIHPLGEGPVDDLGLSVYRADGALTWTATAPGGDLSRLVDADPESTRSDPETTDDPQGSVAAAAGRLVGEVLSALVAADPQTPVGALAEGAAVRGRSPGRAAGSLRGPLPDPSPSPTAARPPTAPELFEAAVAAHPTRIAVVDEAGGISWTYAQFAAHVHALGEDLRRRTAPGEPVALERPRGAHALVALLACLTTGRVAVPVDPTWPAARREELRSGVGARLVLDSAPGDLAGVSDPAGPGESTGGTDRSWVNRDAVAYVIHTSGSTGRPKGVAVTHDALAHFLQHHRAVTLAPFAEAPLRIAQTLPLEFDGSWDTVQGLFLGHEVHVLPRDVVRDPVRTVAAVRSAGLEFVDTTPTVLSALLDEGLLAPGHRLRMLSVGGEACPPSLWARLVAEPGLQVANFYGPTEATVDAVGLVHRGAHGDPLPVGDPADSPSVSSGSTIGRPLTQVQVRVLDPHLAPVPDGIVGELWLAGPHLALGYVGRADLTAERFVADPVGQPGTRMYRTGDLVSVRPDGLLNYHGRSDGQVKVRGYRVEPGEVEAGLRRIDAVRSAAVLARDGRLVGYVAGADLDGRRVREAARAVLPEHLVPARIVVLAQLPRTGTGKLDTAALPEPDAVVQDAADDERAPLTGRTQLVIARTLAEVLDVPSAEITADSDFFGLGGDSITAIRIVAQLRRAGVRTSVGAVFTARTVARIAATATLVGTGEDAVGAVPGSQPDAPQPDAQQPDGTQPGPTRGGEAPRPTQPDPQLDEAQLAAVHDLLARRSRRTRQPERTR